LCSQLLQHQNLTNNQQARKGLPKNAGQGVLPVGGRFFCSTAKAMAARGRLAVLPTFAAKVKVGQ